MFLFRSKLISPQDSQKNLRKILLCGTLLFSSSLAFGQDDPTDGHVVGIGSIAGHRDHYPAGDVLTNDIIAKLSADNRQVSVRQECGAEIHWTWDVRGVSYNDGQGTHVIGYLDNQDVNHDVEGHRLDYASVSLLDADRPWKVRVTVPLPAHAHRGYTWTCVARATASQTPNPCHPNGWLTATDINNTFFDDSAPGGTTIATSPAPYQPSPLG